VKRVPEQGDRQGPRAYCWRGIWYVIVHRGREKGSTNEIPSPVPAMRFVEMSFITVDRTSHMREEASDSSVREVGDVGHMTSAVSSKAVIQDRWHTFLEPTSRHGRDEYDEQKTGQKPGKFRFLESQSNPYGKAKSGGGKFSPDEPRVATYMWV
jgi:hypothetical protein